MKRFWTGTAVMSAGLFAVGPAGVAVPAPPTAAQLLAKVTACRQISNGRYASDEGRPRTIPVCGARGAVFWKADMDIDCDGARTRTCNERTDRSFLNATALSVDGKPLDAAATRYVVLPQPTSTFDFRTRNVRLRAVAAIIFKGKLTYAVFGDTGPKTIAGEASYAAAKTLGINPNPATGGVASGVTYIVFSGTRVAKPRNNASIDAAGRAAASKFLVEN